MKTASPAKPAKRTERQSLCFTVCFDGMTDRIRDFWMEGRYAHAYDCLEGGFNLTRDQATAVLAGKKRMADLPGGRKGIDGTLIDDNWTPPEGTLYPEPGDIKRAELEAENYRLKLRVAQDDEAFAEIRARHEREAEEEEERTRPRRRTGVEAFVHRQIELDRKPTPKPDREYRSNNGWIARNGVMFPCEQTMEHGWLASRIFPTDPNPEHRCEREGFVKVGYAMMGVHVFSHKKPTQKQIDAVFQWAARDEARRERPAKEWLDRWSHE